MHRSARRGLTLAIAGFLAAAVFALTANAQTGDGEPKEGRLFFTSNPTGEEDSSLDCGDMPHYNLTAVDESQNNSSRAPAAVSYGLLACPSYFEHNVTEGFNITGNATIEIFFGCEETTVLRNDAGRATVGVDLQRNGEDIEDADADWTSEDDFCTPDDSPYRAVLVVEDLDASFEEGDILGLQTYVWSSDTSGGNVYFVAGGNNSSSIRAPGLPEPRGLGEPPSAEDFAVMVEPSTLTVTQGGSADAKLALTNNGTGDVGYEWGLEDLPSGVTVDVEPANGTVAANGTSRANLTLETEAETPPGEHNVFVNATLEGGLNVTHTLVLVVQSAEGGAGNGTGGATATPFPMNATGSPTPTDGADEDGDNATQLEDEEGGIPAPGVLIAVAALAIAAAVVAARRRRQ